MSKVGLLIIAHNQVGDVMLATAAAILGQPPLAVENLPVPLDSDPDATTARARELVARLNQGSGVLVLTDMYGSTPGNIACRLLDDEQVRVVSGLSLPMLFRVFNYSGLALDALAEKAASGARDSVLLCTKGNG